MIGFVGTLVNRDMCVCVCVCVSMSFCMCACSCCGFVDFSWLVDGYFAVALAKFINPITCMITKTAPFVWP